MIRLILIWVMSLVVLVVLVAAACGPLDLHDQLDDHDDWSRS